MFDLDRAIKDWRRQLAAVGLKSSAVRDELENHLREDVERQVQSGTPDQQAFKTALRQLGQAGTLTDEFAKINETHDVSARIKKFILALAGFQNPILATNMNTSSSNENLEPAWATYVKSGAFALPAAFLWLCIAVFVLPKFNQVVHQSGLRLPSWIDTGWNLARFVSYHRLIFCGAVILALALLEWRSTKWPRYRRAAVGVGAFLLNSAVLIAISLMAVIALIAGPMLAHH